MEPDTSVRDRTSGRQLARSSILNFASQTLPLALTIVVVPILIRQLGTERFGILAFLWTILTVFGISDLGIGYVATQLVAARLGSEDRTGVPAIFWTCAALMLIVGALLLVGFMVVAPWLADHGLASTGAHRDEVKASLVILGFCLPISLLATVCRGFLEAHQRFVLRNVIVLLNGSLMLVAPAVVALIAPRLDLIAAALLATRVIILVLFVVGCVRVVPGLLHSVTVRLDVARQALKLTGWMSINTIINPLLIYADRFFISGLVSVAAVGYYFVPYELATKLSIVVFSMTTVLMPAFAMTKQYDKRRAAELFEISLKIGVGIVFIEGFALSAFADQVLVSWLGSTVVPQSTVILQLILVGVFINAVGALGISFVLGVGRPDIVARLYLIEAVVFVPLTFLLVKSHGIVGAAAAWSIRVSCDSLVLLWLARRLMPPTESRFRLLGFLIAGTLALFGLMLLPMWGFARIAYVIVIPIVLYGAGWRFILSQTDRAAVRWMIGSFLAGKWLYGVRPNEP